MSELRRELGIFSSTMLVAGNMIGIGIFVTAGRIYGHLPDPKWVLLAWIFGGFLSVAGGLAYAELGTRFPRAGGAYVYLREAFGPLLGFLAGFSASLVTIPGTTAFLAIGFTRYAGITDPWLAKSIAVALILGISLVNYWGVLRGAELQNGFMILKLALIFLLVLAGFLSGNGSVENFMIQGEATKSLLVGLPLAMIPVMYTYSGWDATAYVSGEIKEPRRTIPIALFLGSFSVTIVYLLLAALYLYALPVTAPEAKTRIATAASTVFFGETVGKVVGGLVAVSILGTLSATILTGPRIVYAMAKDKLFPSMAQDVHPVFATPGKAIWFEAAWASILAITGTFDMLLDYVTVPSVFFAAFAVVGLFVVRARNHSDADSVPFKTLGYPVLPGLFVLSMFWIIVNTVLDPKARAESLWGLLIVSLGIPTYFIWKRWTARDDLEA